MDLEEKPDTAMSDWEVTATTLYCRDVADEVTIMIRPDGTCRCTGYNKYFHPDKDASRTIQDRGRKLGKKLACTGITCILIESFRQRLAGEKK